MLMKLSLFGLLAVLAALCWRDATAEFYSSVHAMSKVFRYEQQMLQHMQKFIADNESKLDFLRA